MGNVKATCQMHAVIGNSTPSSQAFGNAWEKRRMTFRCEKAEFAIRTCSLCCCPTSLSAHAFRVLKGGNGEHFYAFCSRCVRRMAAALAKAKKL